MCWAPPQAPALPGGSSPVGGVQPWALAPPGCSAAQESALGRDGTSKPAPCGAAHSQAASLVTAGVAGQGAAAARARDTLTALGRLQQLPAGPVLQALDAAGDMVPEMVAAEVQDVCAAPGRPQ